MKILFMFAISLLVQAAEPVTSAWILSRPAANEALRKLLPDVHEVVVQDQFVEVRSAGLSLLFLGPFQMPLTADGGVRDLRFRIPRKPVPAEGDEQRIGPGAMGVFLNGVPLYNRFGDDSYLGRNMWHFDTVARPLTLGVLAPIIAKGDAHSPLLGFALDGYPIYGPWGFGDAGSLQRMRSGYRLRNIHERTRWADGKELTPSQYGPPVDDKFPLGTFAEDYEYRPEPGDLDESNGRFCRTPEFPQGTYAYFLTTTDTGQLAFPYFLTERFHGKLPNLIEHNTLETGKPADLRFAFPGARSLEIVHEKPVHLMIVSSDLTEFAHIHPQWTLGDCYSVRHSFSRPGKYRLFAQFTLPGEAERVETFDIEVEGDPLSTPLLAQPIQANLRKPASIHTGEDVPFTVELSGAPIEPYLGAWGHFVLIDQSLNNFIHAHPAESIGTTHVHGVRDAASGPPPSSVSFTTNFSQPGTYKLWAQFQVAGEAIAIPFIVEVSKGAPVSRTLTTAPASAISVAVDSSGFRPARIEVKGKATLAITRGNTPNCGSQIVFPSLGIQRDLPLGATTIIELPALTGNVSFACGMGMLRGMIVGISPE